MLKRGIAALLLCLMAAALALPVGARAQNTDKIVRVGWYESQFNTTDELGRRSGYAYEYQQKIAAYTGWVYEYVEGSWPDLLQMLMDGRIDLLSGVSYTPEREETMLFSSLPMGAEEYYIYISPNNNDITPADYTTFNGKKVGINKGSVQAGLFREWAAANGVEAEIVEMQDPIDKALVKLNTGVIDMYVVVDAYLNIKTAVPVCKIGASDFYFAVSKARPELLAGLNTALSRIQGENKYYNEQLNKKYIHSSGVNYYLTPEETAWLNGHGAIRVGYQDNYLAFCASDPMTGELTGALKEYLRIASDSLENAHLDFQAIAFPNVSAAMEAMKKGEVDCVFPANLTDYDGETQGFFLTPPLMNTDMSAVVRASDQQSFMKKERILVAVNTGNTNYDMFLEEHFPEWRAIYYKDTPECLRAIADGKADCILISNYRYNNIAELCQELKLVTLSTGVEMDYYFAVNREDILLYSILSKVNGIVPAATVNSALTYYFTEDAKSSLGSFIRQHMGAITFSIALAALAILALLLLNARFNRKAKASQRLIHATETDEITGLYSKRFFQEYAERMYREQPEKPMDAIVLNIDQFHSVNAINGRAFGDQVLRGLGGEILAFLKENGGIAGHEEADHFDIYCSHLNDCRILMDRLQGKLDKLSSNVSIRLRMGVMPWEPNINPLQMLEQALIACNMARGQFKEHLVIFDEKVREREAFEQRLLNDVRHAVENREFEVYYQPKYGIQSEPPSLRSAEALVRWKHPELGMIPPFDFIPLLERNGLIGSVDKYVWTEAARQIAAWKNQYGLTVPVSVNLSRIDVFDPSLEYTLETLRKENGLEYSDLKLEVTESACTENAYQVVNVIEGLRKKGFEIEMDDFGSGYSSLNMLSSMPIDVLKMDKAFVSRIEYEEKDLQLVELILGIARSLKVPVVAEGVETKRQLQLLKDMGCELVQGYYFSRPLPAAEFEANIIGKAVGA
ncbi:MAG: EAL domain-containing protein [Clostridia bacterium]|nr:EAL domain-containing protein [Clostridia bacterium]